jgi:predicted DNA-binding protein
MPKKEATKAIAFRISADKDRRLNQLAAAASQTPGEFAREALLEKLDEGQTTARTIERMQQRQDQLTVELAAFREDFATAIETLLVVIASPQKLTADQAKKWVNLRLRHQTFDSSVVS